MTIMQLPPAEAPPTQPPPTGLPPDAPRGGHRWNWPTWAKVLTIAIVAFFALGIVGILMNHGGTSSSSSRGGSVTGVQTIPPGVAAPKGSASPMALNNIPGAVTFLYADGYGTSVNDLTPSQPATGLDTTVGTAEEGQNASGNAEVVFTTQAGSTSGTLESDVSNDASSAGMTYAVSHFAGYDVIRVTGPFSGLQQFGTNLENDNI